MTKIIHESIRPDRQDIIGEVVFSEHWKRLMATRSEFAESDDDAATLSYILDGKADQRDATVAATIVQWLGTNVGGSIIYEGQRIRRALNGSPHCFLMAWSVGNLSKRWVNQGHRLLALVFVPHDAKRDWAGSPYEVPEVSVRDSEVVERLMSWLGSTAGFAWLEDVEAEIAVRQDAARHYLRVRP